MANAPLRCSILAIGDFPEGGATSQRLYLLAKLLTEGLGDTTLWIMHPTAKVEVRENRAATGTWGGVKFIYLNGRTVRPAGVFGALVDTVIGIYGSVRLIVRRGGHRPDVLVVYTPSFMKFIIPMAVANFLHIPLIVESCEIRSKSTDTYGKGILRRPANVGETLMEKLIPIVSAGLLTISRGIRSYYMQLGMPAHRIHLLPALVDSERYKEGRTAVVKQVRGQQFLLNSGSFREKDGLDYLVEAMARVHKLYPNIRLVFTGTTTECAQQRILNSVESESEPEPWIMFTGFISREQLVWCYRNAAGLLSCRSNSDYANYGFPTKLAEYLASGQPVVATTVGDVEEYLLDQESAFLAEPEKVESIVNAILRLLDNPEHAALVGQRGAEVARRTFDYRNYVGSVATFIRQRIGRAQNGTGT